MPYVALGVLALIIVAMMLITHTLESFGKDERKQK